MDDRKRGCLPCAKEQLGRGTLKPKKLILSRKGFDSGSGGCPSPIFPDDTMISLPILSRDHEQFDDLQHGDVNIASVVAGITGGRINGRDRVHLDPDLNFDTYRYRKNRTAWQQWRGMLGQAGIAQGQLSFVSFFAASCCCAFRRLSVLSIPKVDELVCGYAILGCHGLCCTR